MDRIDRKQVMVFAGFAILLLATPLLVVAVRLASSPQTQASTAVTPREVIFSNVSENSVTISYRTDEAVKGRANLSGAGAIINASDARDISQGSEGSHKLHYLTASNLRADTEYTIEIISDGNSFTDDAWKVKTFKISNQIGTPSPIRGKLTDNSVNQAVVYAVGGNSSGNTSVVSSLMQNNTFTIEKSSFRDKSSGEIASLDGKDILIYIEALDKGRARKQISATGDNAGDLALGSSVGPFNPNQTITPGQDPGDDNDDDDDDDDDEEPVEGEYVIDAQSESLLSNTFSTGAELINATAPYNIFISDVSPTGFTVNWLTKQPVTGHIEIMEANARNKIVDPRDGSIDNSKRRYTHSVRASNPSIPAGTVFEFFLVSNEIPYGRNIQVISEDYNEQFRVYSKLFFGEGRVGVDRREEEFDIEILSSPQYQIYLSWLEANVGSSPTANPAQGSDSSSLSGVSASIPKFEYQMSADLMSEPFKVIIPSAPASPALPKVQLVEVEMPIDNADYLNALSTLSNRNPDLMTPNIDTERDVIISAKTQDGNWTVEYPTVSGGASLSMGSTLNRSKTRYVDLSTGDMITIRVYGPFSSQKEELKSYDDGEPVKASLVDPLAMLGILHNTTLNNSPILYGYADQTNLSLSLRVNGITEITQIRDDNSWQSLTENLDVGYNQIEILDSSGDVLQTFSFVAYVDELPVTSNFTGLAFIIMGIGVILIGMLIYLKYRY